VTADAGPRAIPEPGPVVRPVGPPTPEPAGWTTRELDTLTAVADTFVSGDAARHARLAADALSQAADPDQVFQLRLVMRAFDSRLVNLLLTGRAVRFRALDLAGRERYLLRWATSRIPQRRAAYHGLKRLLTFLAYADPGEDGDNPRLAEIGYEHRPEPVATAPTPIVPLDVRYLAATTPGAGPIVVEADVAVVGSGAGGGVVAADLAAAGRSVVVIEAGPFVPEPALPVDELAAFDRLYLNRGLNVSWDASILTLVGGAVGGGTLVNWLTSVAPPAHIRARWASHHGVDGFDGPAVDADAAAIEAELGVREPPNVPAKDALLLRGAAASGQEGGETRRNGVDCGDCGRCGFGCRRGAKQSGIRAHLAAAWRNGARIVPDAPVERVLVEGGRAAGVEATTAIDGVPRRIVVRAPAVVVAAGTLRTPLVLLRSGIDHPAMGHHLRLHPVAVLGAFLDEDVTMWRGTTQASRSLEGLASGPDADGGGYIVESAPGTPGLIGLVFPWEGRAAFRALMREIRHVAPLLAITSDRGSGRVRLSRTGRPRIDYTVAAEDRRALRDGLAAAARIAWAGGSRRMVALGTPPAWFEPEASVAADARAGGSAFAAYEARLRQFDFRPNRGTVASAHQMGSARAGGDARDYPCDPVGRVRTAGARPGRDATIPGLYVGDASLFPTALGVNPMITTMVWARRVARTVLAETAAG
jgi:choline dehydrogenase-like flavoprotein